MTNKRPVGDGFAGSAVDVVGSFEDGRVVLMGMGLTVQLVR